MGAVLQHGHSGVGSLGGCVGSAFPTHTECCSHLYRPCRGSGARRSSARGKWGAALGLLQSGSVWAVGVLIAGFLLYLTGRMGAGDVKLAAVLSFWAGSDALLFLILLSLVGGLMVLGLPLLRMIETKTGFWAERLAEAFGRPLECTPIGLLGGEAQKGLPYGLAIAAGFAAVQFGVFSHIF